MKVALLTDGLSPFVLGGMQRHSTLLAEHLVAAGVELWLFHTAHGDEQVSAARELESFPEGFTSRVNHIFVEYPRKGVYPGHYLQDSYRYSLRILEAFKRMEVCVDFIYAQGQTGRAFVDAKGQGELSVPIGVNAHGYAMYQPAYSIRSFLEGLILRKTFRDMSLAADYVFAFPGRVSDLVESVIGVPKDKIIVIPNAVDSKWLVSEATPVGRAMRFVFVGRNEKLKGLKDIFSVLNSKNGRDYHFEFIGPVPEGRVGVSPRVKYHGTLANSMAIREIMLSADVLVCPSYAEGMPTVILEAMACGLAIIATDVGSIGELVAADNGVLMDSPGERPLREAMEAMSEYSDSEVIAMKRRSLDKVQAYTWEKTTRHLINELQRCLEPR